MRFFGFVFGILLVVSGVYCVASPVATFASLAWVIGLAMIMDGVGGVFTYFECKELGHVDGWVMVSALLTIALGVFVLGSYAMQVAIDAFLAYLVAFWLVFAGVRRIGASFSIHTLYDAGLPLGKYWFLVLLFGILVTAMGVLCIIDPVVAMTSVGLLIGLGIIGSGLSFTALSLSF